MAPLSEKDKKIIERYLKLRSAYLSLIIFLVLMAIGYVALMVNQFIPAYLAPLETVPDVKKFIQSGFIGLVRMGIFWVFLAICILIGCLITHAKISGLLRRIKDNLDKS